MRSLQNNKSALWALVVGNALTLFVVFFSLSDFDDKADYSGDSWDYQSIAVNYLHGHGFMVHGGLEPFETYQFRDETDDQFCITQTEFNDRAGDFSTYRNPTYPAFLIACYKLFGLRPFRVKVIQLILMVLGSSCLMLFGAMRESNKVLGVASGLLASWLFMWAFYPQTAKFYGESALVFLSGLMMLSWAYYLKEQNVKRLLLLSIIMGLAILSKGLFYFAVLLMIGFLLWSLVSKRKSIFLIQLLVFGATIMVVCGPYVIWQNLRDNRGEQVKLDEQAVAKLQGVWEQVVTVEEYYTALINSEDSLLITMARENQERILTSDFNKVMNRSKMLAAKWQETQNPVTLLIDRMETGKFVVITDQFRDAFLGSHNEHTLDGKWSRKYLEEETSCYTENIDGNPVWMVAGFYARNPRFMLRSMLNKWRNAFLRSKVVSIWLVVSIGALLVAGLGKLGLQLSIVPFLVWFVNVLTDNYLYNRFLYDSELMLALVLVLWVWSISSLFRTTEMRTFMKLYVPFVGAMILTVFIFYGEPRIILPLYLAYFSLLGHLIINYGIVPLSRRTLWR